MKLTDEQWKSILGSIRAVYNSGNLDLGNDDDCEMIRDTIDDTIRGRPVVLPNGLIQGSPEDRATWWSCAVCGFTGPFVSQEVIGASQRLGRKVCGTCTREKVTPNPACTFHQPRRDT